MTMLRRVIRKESRRRAVGANPYQSGVAADPLQAGTPTLHCQCSSRYMAGRDECTTQVHVLNSCAVKLSICSEQEVLVPEAQTSSSHV